MALVPGLSMPGLQISLLHQRSRTSAPKQFRCLRCRYRCKSTYSSTKVFNMAYFCSLVLKPDLDDANTQSRLGCESFTHLQPLQTTHLQHFWRQKLCCCRSLCAQNGLTSYLRDGISFRQFKRLLKHFCFGIIVDFGTFYVCDSLLAAPQKYQYSYLLTYLLTYLLISVQKNETLGLIYSIVCRVSAGTRVINYPGNFYRAD